MTMLTEEHSEVLMDIARSLTGAASGRASMKVIYAKRPLNDANSHKPLTPAQMPGWVTWLDDDTQTGALWLKVAQGWTILKQYGSLGQRDGSPDPLGPWQKILEHPTGPSEFPVEQLMEFGWYDPERVPVQGVRFPQLRGLRIPTYPCPECSDRSFLKPIHLARHCRNAHSYDRKDIQDLAEQLGIDLVKEMYANKERVQVYTYADDDADTTVESEATGPALPAQEFDVEPVRVQPRTTAQQQEWTPERRAAQAAKTRAVHAARRAAAAQTPA